MAKDTLRLDKAVAHNFDVPRSYATKLIKGGDVTVNGEVNKDPASKIDINDEIVIDGNEVSVADGFKKHVYMLNKPNGYVCADRDNNYPIVINLFSDIPKFTQMHCVGRLDMDTTGLILVTDDGDLNHKITTPKQGVTKTYHAATRDKLVEKDIALFAKGLKHPEEKEKYKPALLEIVSDNEALVTVTEGKFHEVKRLFECIGNEVVELKRIYIGMLELDESLEEGEYMELDEETLEKVFIPYKDVK